MIGEHLHDLGVLGPGDAYVPPVRQAEFTLRLKDPGEYRFEAASSKLVLGIDFLLIWLGAIGVADVGVALDGVECMIGAVTDQSLNTALDLWDVARDCAFAVRELVLGKLAGVLLAALKGAVKIPALADLVLDDFVNDSMGRLTVAYAPIVKPPCPVSDDTFCEFVRAIEAALTSGDRESFLAGVAFHPWTCSGYHELGSPCTDELAGTVIPCTDVGILNGGGGCVTSDGYAAYISDLRSAYAVVYPSSQLLSQTLRRSTAVDHSRKTEATVYYPTIDARRLRFVSDWKSERESPFTLDYR